MPAQNRQAKRTRISHSLVIALWVVAITAFVGAAHAAAAAPEVDAMLPTTNASAPCISGGSSPYSGDCRTDNSTVTYYMDSAGDDALEPADRSVVTDILEDIYGPTDLSIAYDSTPSYSGSAQTDVIFREGYNQYFSPNTVGITWCNSAVGGSTHLCDQTFIMIRGMGRYTDISASHEIGHAIGLAHPNDADPWFPACEPGFHVMRQGLNCLSGPELGLMLTRNINHIY